MAIEVDLVRASNAFIYLPLYVAEKYGMFYSVQEHDLRVNGSTFGGPRFSFNRSRSTHPEGDALAIKELYRLAGDKIAFAMCDPLEIIGPGTNSEDFVVFGGIVKKPPFWILNGHKVDRLQDLRFEHLISYGESLKTGHSLAQYTVSQMKKTPRLTTVTKVGDEIDILLKEKHEAGALTTDLIGLSKVIRNVNSDERLRGHRISFSFPTGGVYENFITTALVTTERIWRTQEGKEAAEILLRGLKHAIALIHVSPQATASICEELSTKEEFRSQVRITDEGKSVENLAREEALWIADHLLNDKIYSLDTTITKADWVAAANNGRWGSSTDNKLLKQAEEIYGKVVKNDDALEGESTRKTIMAITPHVDIKKIYDRQHRAERAFNVSLATAFFFGMLLGGFEFCPSWASSANCSYIAPYHGVAANLFFSLCLVAAISRWLMADTRISMKPAIMTLNRFIDWKNHPWHAAVMATAVLLSLLIVLLTPKRSWALEKFGETMFATAIALLISYTVKLIQQHLQK